MLVTLKTLKPSHKIFRKDYEKPRKPKKKQEIDNERLAPYANAFVGLPKPQTKKRKRGQITGMLGKVSQPPKLASL